MRHVSRLAALLSVCTLIGCGSNYTAPAPSVPDVSGNWQIQSATGAPNPGILLVGALSDNSGAITGTMRFTNLVPGNSCGVAQQPVAFTGTLSRTFVLTMTSAPLASGSVITVTLSVDPYAHNLAFGSIQVAGGSCVYGASEAAGENLAAITGTYAGTTVAAQSIQSTPTGNGVATLNIMQASAPNSDGQYNVTGTFQFVSGVCGDTQPVTGKVSGAGLTLTSASVAGVSEVVISAGVDRYGAQLPGTTVMFNAGACSTGLPAYDTYNGPLNKQ